MKMKYFLGEFIGTFILSSSLNFMTVYSPLEGTQQMNIIGVIVGFFIALQFSRNISGGHLNPGVTIMFYFENKQSQQSRNCVSMITGQLLGAFMPPLFALLLIDNSLQLNASANSTYFNALLAEFIASLVFFSIILAQSSKEMNLTSSHEYVSSGVIAVGLAAGISIAGNHSGAGLNPAIALFQNLFALLETGDLTAIKYLPVYIISPLLASYVAVKLVAWLIKIEKDVKSDINYINLSNQIEEEEEKPSDLDNYINTEK